MEQRSYELEVARKDSLLLLIDILSNIPHLVAAGLFFSGGGTPILIGYCLTLTSLVCSMLKSALDAAIEIRAPASQEAT